MTRFQLTRRMVLRAATVTVTGFALLITSMPQSVGAAEQDPAAVATTQVQNCEAGGGTATVEVERTNSGGLYTEVHCKGGLFDGISCDNARFGSHCYGGMVVGTPSGPHVAPGEGIIADVESGTVPQSGATAPLAPVVDSLPPQDAQPVYELIPEPVQEPVLEFVAAEPVAVEAVVADVVAEPVAVEAAPVEEQP